MPGGPAGPECPPCESIFASWYSTVLWRSSSCRFSDSCSLLSSAITSSALANSPSFTVGHILDLARFDTKNTRWRPFAAFLSIPSLADRGPFLGDSTSPTTSDMNSSLSYGAHELQYKLIIFTISCCVLSLHYCFQFKVPCQGRVLIYLLGRPIT